MTERVVDGKRIKFCFEKFWYGHVYLKKLLCLSIRVLVKNDSGAGRQKNDMVSVSI
jgi:hypothetical protein